VYDPPFELYVGDYAFAYSHEFPNELLALFTEQDRRPPAELEAGEPKICGQTGLVLLRGR
jgi:hypothetical protein